VFGSLPVAFALAWLLGRKRFPGKLILDGIVHLPLVLPPVVTGWLLLLLFGPYGPAGRLLEQWFGVSVMFRWTGAAIAEAIDPRLEQAARTLGASPRHAFLTVSLPLAIPGVLVAAVLGFARSLGEFGATITFVSNIPGETRTLPIAIYSALQVPGGEGIVTRLAIISVILSLGALVASEALARRGGAGARGHVL
jgi:molybdate transport system permease protein